MNPLCGQDYIGGICFELISQTRDDDMIVEL